MISGCFSDGCGVFSCMKLYGLPGGNQVDGLPPAASSGAGVGGRPFGRAVICNLMPVFSNFVVFLTGRFRSNQFYFVLWVKLQWFITLVCWSMRFR